MNSIESYFCFRIRNVRCSVGSPPPSKYLYKIGVLSVRGVLLPPSPPIKKKKEKKKK